MVSNDHHYLDRANLAVEQGEAHTSGGDVLLAAQIAPPLQCGEDLLAEQFGVVGRAHRAGALPQAGQIFAAEPRHPVDAGGAVERVDAANSILRDRAPITRIRPRRERERCENAARLSLSETE